MTGGSTTLDLDIGNSSTKWRIGTQTGRLTDRSIPRLCESITRVRIACVAGEDGVIAAAIKREYGVTCEFARSQLKQAGLRNAYEEPSQLGVDRWLAMLAAWCESQRNCVVVDAGTALTVDAVASNGQHQGGYIVPGLAAGRLSLAQETRDVQFKESSQKAEPSVFGVNTRQAVLNGTLSMMISFVRTCIQQSIDQLGEPCDVYLCGGGSDALVPHLDSVCIHRPGLVFDGLEIALP